MADVDIKIGSSGSRIDNSPVTIGDISGRDHIEHGKAESDTQARMDAIDKRLEEVERFTFGDNRLGVSSIREEIRGLKFWLAASAIVTVVWVLCEIIITVAR